MPILLNKYSVTKMNKSAPIQLDTTSSDIVLQYATEAHVTATNVFNCAIRTQSHVYTIHGPGSEHEDKETFPHVHNTTQVQGQDLYCKAGEVVHINPHTDNLISIILSGLRKNTVIIHGKLNHILVRRSEGIKLFIERGTMSGVDILHCRNMLVQMPYHNFTNLEYGEGVYFQADVNDVSQLHITGSIDVKLNEMSLPINPFMSAMFAHNGWCYKEASKIPKLMLCRF